MIASNDDPEYVRWQQLGRLKKRELIALHFKLVRATGLIQIAGIPFYKLKHGEMVTEIMWLELSPEERKARSNR